MSRSGCWWFPMSLINSQEKQPALLDQVHDLHIAMEPGLGGQEKTASLSSLQTKQSSQWSLAVAARKSETGVSGPIVLGSSQWSLAVAARKSPVGPFSHIGSVRSQWSLAVAARKSSAAAAHPRPGSAVAMEPGLGGQEKAHYPPEYSGQE